MWEKLDVVLTSDLAFGVGLGLIVLAVVLVALAVTLEPVAAGEPHQPELSVEELQRVIDGHTGRPSS